MLLALLLAWAGPIAIHAAPLHLRLVPEDQHLRLSWEPAADDAMFTVETTPQLDPADWQPLNAGGPWPTSATNVLIPRGTASAAFFRVVASSPYPRGAVLTNVFLRHYTTVDLEEVLEEFPVPGISPVPVDAWRIIYATVDAHGSPTRASALLTVPVGVTNALPIASYQHGTVVRREDVPSRLNTEGLLGVILAASTYIGVLPDYLGLGDSPGSHPYHHAQSEATAVVDALRAARDSLGAADVQWNGQLFLCGYSQGGHATLAAQREIETRHSDEFTITASAPSAGAYDLSGTTLNDFLSPRLPPNPFNYAYFLSAYIDVYGLAPDLSAWLREPYDTTVPPLFDGTHSGSEINQVLPANPTEILRPDILEALRADPEHPLRLALRANDLYRDWVPRSRTRLHHCRDDADVLLANSQVAYAAFIEAGATTVELVDPWPPADHGFCAITALLATKLWFDSLRE